MSISQKSPLLFYTSSDDKIHEARSILGIDVKKAYAVTGLREVQSLNLEEVVRDKAIRAYEMNDRQAVLVEHTGLFISYLSGLPGAMSKVFLDTLGCKAICSLIKGRRAAEAKTCLGFYNGHHVFFWTGSVRGRIAYHPTGIHGFGWDNIFIPEKQKIRIPRTFAQMNLDEKNRYSMRQLAFQKMKETFTSDGSISLQELITTTKSRSTIFHVRLMRKETGDRVHFEPLQTARKAVARLSFDKTQSTLILSEAFQCKLPLPVHQLKITAVRTPDTCPDAQGSSTVKGAYFFRIDFPINSKFISTLNKYMGTLRQNKYVTYGDSILKVLRNYIIPAIEVNSEDSLYVLRSSNAKFYDDILQLRTATGEALYYNPGDMVSPLKYVWNAVLKSRNRDGMNELFRKYVLPEVASVWVYSISAVKSFADKKGGFFYVPVISLAEVAAHVLRQVEAKAPNRLISFLSPYLRRYSLEDVKNTWAYKAFDLFPDKRREADLHLEIIRRLLKKHGKAQMFVLLEKPRSFADIKRALLAYVQVLRKESHDEKTLYQYLRDQFPGKPICFTELIILAPGMKDRRYEIPATPEADTVFLQGLMDLNGGKDGQIGQLVRAHNVARSFLPSRTWASTVLDHAGLPFADPRSKACVGRLGLQHSSVLLEFFALMMLKNLSPTLKRRLLMYWVNARKRHGQHN